MEARYQLKGHGHSQYTNDKRGVGPNGEGGAIKKMDNREG